jgi:hypothetical protein
MCAPFRHEVLYDSHARYRPKLADDPNWSTPGLARKVPEMSDEVLSPAVKKLRTRVAQSGVCINNCVSSSFVANCKKAVLLDCCITVGKKWNSLANSVLRLAGAGVQLSVSELPS